MKVSLILLIFFCFVFRSDSLYICGYTLPESPFGQTRSSSGNVATFTGIGIFYDYPRQGSYTFSEIQFQNIFRTIPGHIPKFSRTFSLSYNVDLNGNIRHFFSYIIINRFCWEVAFTFLKRSGFFWPYVWITPCSLSLIIEIKCKWAPWIF